jgi:hypothetical protein
LDPAEKDPKNQRLHAGDAVALERESGDWMKGVVVAVEEDGIDVVVDGSIVEGELLSVSRTVRDDARYTAVMEVVDAAPGRSRVRLVGEWKRVQMRRSVRVSVFDGCLDVGGDDGGRLLDLSAGGLRFESEQEHAPGDVLDLHLQLPQTGPVSVRGEVVRVIGRRTEDSGPRQYGVRFCGLDEAVRVKIMTWVFAEQARRFRDSPKPDIETEAGDDS